MKSSIEIAQQANLKPITEIAAKLGIESDALHPYGRYKAKIDHQLVKQRKDKANGKLILVTAVNPTPAGEGKTTISVGLADALSRHGKKAMLVIREPSLGPVFGIKGGAAGGGYAQVVPMEDINLHFTGDLHAIAAANNLLAAMIDNSIYHGNPHNLHPNRITWKRCIDMNDRQLRFMVNGLGGNPNGIPRQDGFDITAASEVMAIFCLAENLVDLKARLAKIVVGFTYDGKPVTCGAIGAAGAMAALLKDAFNPNLVQTIEHTPALIHGGPFANIAHGCNSLIATQTALKLADYTVTEAGFGADLGAEKFLDIKCRKGGLQPDAVVIVATVRALKHHGGCPKEQLGVPNTDFLAKGSANLLRHIENMRDGFGLPVCVAINAFPTDSAQEHEFLFDFCKKIDVPCALGEVFTKGGEGALDLAQKVIDLANSPSKLTLAYRSSQSLKEKVVAVCTKVYRANSVTFEISAAKQLAEIEAMGYGELPVCIAKTQYSFSDEATLLAAPEHFHIHVREIRLSAGAGFVVFVCGAIMTMPGLGKVPSAVNIDLDENGLVTGLF
ncbi:MAG TPA: formate--tetrahydrofolate ligase [Clostridia bacterium]|nr:formate--tetrahydrofolate ligase [Clostridia bacterium]